MAKAKTPKAPKSKNDKPLGLGFVPAEARHGFLISVPAGSAQGDLVCISEHRGNDLDNLADRTLSADTVVPSDPSLRVMIDRARWLALAPAFWDEANIRLRANGYPQVKFQKNPSKPIPVHPSLGKELCVLCWAVEEASIDDIPNAIRNWEALAPEERWWLYTMTVATTGQAMNKSVGWRKALRAALSDNPFIKGEGVAPKSRRELLGHPQMSLKL
jgi:hypothetical protein